MSEASAHSTNSDWDSLSLEEHFTSPSIGFLVPSLEITRTTPIPDDRLQMAMGGSSILFFSYLEGFKNYLKSRNLTNSNRNKEKETIQNKNNNLKGNRRDKGVLVITDNIIFARGKSILVALQIKENKFSYIFCKT